MKIYNVMKVPQGLGYEEVDYDALYQSGYTAGYNAGYNDGMDLCSDFDITPSELVYQYSGGGKEVEITAPTSWHIDDSDFEWEYNIWSPMYGETTWTGFSADSLNRIEVSEEAGVGDKTITVSTPDTGDIQKVCVATYVTGYQTGYAAPVTERSGKLKASAETEYGAFQKDINLTQHIGSGWNVKSTGGTVQLYLDAADPGFKEYHLGLAYHFLNPYPDPWGNYPLQYSGSVSELPKVIDLFVPPYTEGLDPYWYGEDGEINVYYGLQFEPEERDPSVPYIDDARLYVQIPQTDVRLNVTHNFPEPEYSTINVPETGATYTMTISGNSNWSANTVSFTSGVLCTLSQSSGAANESTTVTVTFANDGVSKSGLIEILTQADRTVQGVNYFLFQFRQEAPEPPAA